MTELSPPSNAIPYQRYLSGDADLAAIEKMRLEFDRKLQSEHLLGYASALKDAPDISDCDRIFDQATVAFKSQAPLSASEAKALQKSLDQFRPWKKGPFDLFGNHIDAEWRSDLKWARLQQHLPDLKDKVIADIGCHNGYFMYRMLPYGPAHVIGFEPVPKHWFNFQLLQKYAAAPKLSFEGIGVENIDSYQRCFDVIFCLGILYHHTDPVGLLRKIHSSMTTGGSLVIDCQGIPGTEPSALVPKSRYCGASGIWFLPTETTLSHWLVRAGFRDVDIFFNEALTVEEQRSTPWADIKSLSDFLDPKDNTKTIEGYPAPHRIYATARR